MKKVISTLINDHKKMIIELNSIDNNISTNGEIDYLEIQERFKSFKNFTLYQHHITEEEKLYQWMLDQNPNADSVIIKRIKADHKDLENKQDKIIFELHNIIMHNKSLCPKSTLFNIRDFIDSYKEHIQVEEKFIFQIAESIIDSK